MSTIPASSIVNVIPSVVSAGGTGLQTLGLMLTNNTRVPIGTVQSFPNLASVNAYFGSTAQEATLAATYFAGNTTATQTPAAILIAQYPSNPVGAYLRGGSLAAVTLATLQTFTGNLGLTIDGTLHTASISLSGATSFSNAAEIIGQSLAISGPQVATFTGSSGGTTLSVGTLTTGTIGVGDVLSGTAAGLTANTYIVSQLTGAAGGTGTYQLSSAQTILPNSPLVASAPAVTFDSVSSAFIIISPSTGNTETITFGTGALATSLLLTSTTGAVLSQGTAGATPTPFMNGVIAVTQNWATFFTVFNPDTILGGGNVNKLLFAAWTNGQNNRYAYLVWDADASPTVSFPATASLGYLVGPNGNNYSGTSVWYDPTNEGLVAAVSGSLAQLNFNQTNGRATVAFDTYSGLLATVTTQAAASNLLANGYNFYGAYGTANATFVFSYNGSISGPFLWLDSYINQIWMNSQFQLTLLNLLLQVNSIPYNAAGNSLIDAALASPIQAALNFGAIRAGVVLSSTQILTINTAAGANVAATVSNQGWYLQVLPAAPAVRAARTSPPVNFWYCDGQSVQQITMASIEVQ